MCLPPHGLVISTASPAFPYRAAIYAALSRFVDFHLANHPSPPNLARQLHANLKLVNLFPPFHFAARETTVASCHEQRELPALAPNQVIFDTTVCLEGFYYHLCLLAYCSPPWNQM